jgi:two-component system, NtrC family, response regulator HydG
MPVGYSLNLPTGAHNTRGGHFERADGGTLFLDEVASLSPAIQAKLLRVLEDRSVGRLGGHRSRLVDVRVIAACNEDLRDVARRGQFREDLYFRLCVYPIRVPPLRERRDDIPLLIQHFVRLYQGIHNKRAGLITGRALRLLLQYDYPGNVRELEHMIERAVIRAAHDEPLDLSHLDLARTPRVVGEPHEASLSGAPKGASAGGIDAEVNAAADPNVALNNPPSLKEVEEALLRRALSQHRGNRTAAARALKISRRQFNYRLAKYSAR